MKDAMRDKMILHMFESACGYGLEYGDFRACMLSIPDTKFLAFTDTLYRIAEKTGCDGFSLEESN